MKTRIKLLIVILFGVFVQGLAQAIRVSTQVLPPYSQYISDYQSRPGQILITLINTSRQSYQVQLVGSITGDNDVSIRTKGGYRSASPIQVPAGATVRVSQADIMVLFNDAALDFTGTSANEILRKNTLPEGMYQICVQALDYASLQPLSAGEPLGCSAPFPLQSLEPPIFIRPANEEVVNAPIGSPQNLVFTWSTPASAPPSTQYRLKIFEHFNPARNPNDIVRAAGLALFDQPVRGNTYLYGPGQPMLQRGRNYVAILQAVDPSGRASVFRNEGFSEPLVFQYGMELVPVSGSSGGSSGGGGSTGFDSNIPTSKIKGSILWSFKKNPTGEDFSYTEGKFGSNKYSTVEVAKFMMDVNYNGNNPQQPSANPGSFFNGFALNANLAGGPVTAAGNNTGAGKSASAAILYGGVGTFGQTGGKSISEAAQAALRPDGLINITEFGKYPLQNTKLNIYALKPGVDPSKETKSSSSSIGVNNKTASNATASFSSSGSYSLMANAGTFGNYNKEIKMAGKVLIATVKTDEKGDFEVDFMNPGLFVKDYDRLHVEINDPNFQLNSATFPMPKVLADGSLPIADFGTLSAEAFNYVFIPKITDGEGKDVKDVMVKLYRISSFYDKNTNHQKEGNIIFDQRKSEKIAEIGEQVTEIGRAYHGQKVFNLFYNRNYNERYYLLIKKQGYETIITDLQLAPIGNKPGVITLSQEFKLLQKLPVVKGVVYFDKGGIKVPVANSRVTLYFDNGWVNEIYPTYSANNFSNKDFNEKYNKKGLNSTLKGQGGAAMHEIMGLSPAEKAKLKAAGGVPNYAASYYSGKASEKAMAPILAALGNQMVATTDSAGGFIFTDVPVAPAAGKHYKLVTKIPGVIKPKLDSVLCDRRGLIINIPIVVSPEMVTVTGRTVDKNGQALGNAMIRWQSDGRQTTGGNSGAFLTKNMEGRDTLIITKYGYAEKRIGLNVKVGGSMPSGGNLYDKLASGLGKTKTYEAVLNTKPNPSPGDFGIWGNANYLGNVITGGNKDSSGGGFFLSGLQTGGKEQMYSSMFSAIEELGGFMDIGDIVLEKKMGRVRFIVKDAVSKAAIQNVKISLPDFEMQGTTDAAGQWLAEGPSGNVLAVATAAFASGYAPQTVEVSPADDGSVTSFEILLSKGVKVTGKVTAAAANIADANVEVLGREYINTKTAADGSYSLIVPAGEYALKASKSGYVAKEESRTFVLGTDAVVNITLGDAGGKDLTTMLGFNIEVEKMEPNGAGALLTGYFVNFKPMGPFKAMAGKKLRFNAIAVTWDGSNKPVPAGNQVTCTDTQLEFKGFDFLPLRVSRPAGILVKRNAASKGVVEGLIEISLEQVIGSTGVNFPNGFKPNLSNLNTGVPQELSVFTEDGSFPYGAEFFMAAANQEATEYFESKKLKISLYNFEARLDLGKCSIKADGLHLVGAIKTTGIPLLGERTFDFEQFHMGTDFGIKAVSVKVLPPPTITVASTWSATLNSLGFNENGFKIGGNMKVKIPASAESVIDFANLLFGKGTVYGGSFTLPASGIDVFSIVKMKPGATPLSFGQFNGTSVYYLAGSGKFNFPKLIDNTITVKSFQIQTDAKFAATVEANLTVNILNIAKINIVDIGFSTLNNSPEVLVNGSVKLQIPFFDGTVGGIHYKPGGMVSMDEMAVAFDLVGVAKVGVGIKLVDSPGKQGFEGKGKLAITGTPVNAAMAFHYYKVSGGVDVGADFEAGVQIPIGVVMLEKVGGGFAINTANNSFYLKIKAAGSITGTGPLIKLDPVQVEVFSGPILKGTLGVVVGSAFTAATAVVTVDVPQAYFAINVDSQISPMPDLASARAQGDLIISAKSGNQYMFFGVGFDVNLFGLINTRGGFALGGNLKDAKNHERASFYLSSAPDAYLSGGTFTGVYVYGLSKMGVDKNHAWGFDAFILSAKAWLYSESNFYFIGNFNNGNFQVRSSLKYGGGVEGCLVGLCAGVGLSCCLDVAGGFNDAQGWNFNGVALGTAEFGAGDDHGCNDYSVCCWPGFKVCIGARLNVSYKSRDGGLGLSFSKGDGAACN